MKYLEFDPKRQLKPADIVIDCIEQGAQSILIDEDAVPAECFDLSSGWLGELLHKMSVYRIPLAIVIKDPERYSLHFQSFLREANQGNSIRSYKSRSDAIRWLTER